MLCRIVRRLLSSMATRDGNFVDHLVVKVTAGKGGSGCAAFDRSKVKAKGRPAGGNGGPGGDVIFRVDRTKNSLQHVEKHIKAMHGQPGGKGNMVGAKGEDALIDLPPGTVVRELIADEGEVDRLNSRIRQRIRQVDPIDGGNTVGHLEEQIRRAAFEFSDQPGEAPRTVCAGGKGGRGNISMGQSNRTCERGAPGEHRVFVLDLNTIADIGLVGLPNAGKSSFLAAVSNAHPKIAPYPFTTLNPYVGTIQYGDHSSITVADIPGLIEGAHRNIGLGHKFLKHVVKSRALAFVLDFARPDPAADFRVLCNELDLFEGGLAARCRLIIANKVDLLADPDASLASVRQRLPAAVEVVPISALRHTGIAAATACMKRLVQRAAPVAAGLEK